MAKIRQPEKLALRGLGTLGSGNGEPGEASQPELNRLHVPQALLY